MRIILVAILAPMSAGLYGSTISERLEAGESPDSVIAFGQYNQKGTLLGYAIEESLYEDVTLLLKNGVNIEKPTGLYSGTTPLQLACLKGEFDVAKMLISKGADVNAVGQNGLPPVGQAMISPQHEGNSNKQLRDFVDFLVSKGAKLDYVTSRLKGLLDEEGFIDVAMRQADPYFVNLALEKGTLEIPRTDPLLHSVISRIYRDNLASIRAYLEYLKKEGSLPLRINQGGNQPRGASPLWLATKENLNDHVKVLLEYGADPEREDGRGYAPLHIASLNGNIDLIKEFIEKHSVDINATNKWGQTPLHCAVSESNYKAVEVLLKYKPDLGKEDEEGRTPIEMADEAGNTGLKNLMLRHSKAQ